MEGDTGHFNNSRKAGWEHKGKSASNPLSQHPSLDKIQTLCLTLDACRLGSEYLTFKAPCPLMLL